MSTPSDAARLVWPTVRGDALSREALAWVRRGVGGVVLDVPEGASPADVARMVGELKRRAERPLVVAAIHEGGPSPLRHPFTELPTMAAVGLSGELKLAAEIGRVVGEELRALGVDVNLAPVLDVDTREDNPFVAGRSFGVSPHICGAFGGGWIEAQQAAGVAACAKHFPGLGELGVDPREGPQALALDRDRLGRVELPPFLAAVDRGVAALLVGHAAYGGIDDRPASQSPAVVAALLRGEMGFDRFVLADDATMSAAGRDAADAAVASVVAGCDAVLVGGPRRAPDAKAGVDAATEVERVFDALDAAVVSRVIDAARLQNARRRLDALASAYARPPQDDPDLSCIGGDDHRVVMEQVWRLAETDRTP